MWWDSEIRRQRDVIFQQTGEEYGEGKMHEHLDAQYGGDTPSARFIGGALKRLIGDGVKPLPDYSPWNSPLIPDYYPVPMRVRADHLLRMNLINKAVHGVGLSPVAAQWAERIDFGFSSPDEFLRWLVIDQYVKVTESAVYPPAKGMFQPQATSELDLFIALEPWSGADAKATYSAAVQANVAPTLIFQRLAVICKNLDALANLQHEEATQMAVWANRKLGLPYDLVALIPTEIEIPLDESYLGINPLDLVKDFVPGDTRGRVSYLQSHTVTVRADYTPHEYDWRSILRQHWGAADEDAIGASNDD